MNNSTIIIIVVVIFAIFLIYTQMNQPKIVPNAHIAPFMTGIDQTTLDPNILAQHNLLANQHLLLAPNVLSHQSQSCEKCDLLEKKIQQLSPQLSPIQSSIVIENDPDPYSDPIKKQDLYTMYDHLTYPQMRLPREILDKYREYYQQHGVYPAFNQSTKPLFDNAILNGYLVKVVDENEPFTDNVPSAIPLFRQKSEKNTNRFFYYIIDQRYQSRLELKIPLDNVKINGVRYENSDYYGLPELYEGDIINNISIYPSSKFKVMLYRQHHFP